MNECYWLCWIGWIVGLAAWGSGVYTTPIGDQPRQYWGEIKMGKLKGSLTNLNDVLGPFPVYNYINGGVSVQYGTGGSGTIVLEVSLDEDDDSTIQWVQIQMKNPNDIAGAPIANLAAAGLGVADVVGYRLIRIRKSVAGAGPVTVSMCVGIG